MRNTTYFIRMSKKASSEIHIFSVTKQPARRIKDLLRDVQQINKGGWYERFKQFEGCTAEDLNFEIAKVIGTHEHTPR